MTDRALIRRPDISASVDALERFSEDAMIVTTEGEIIHASDASNEDLIAWVVSANEMRRIAAQMIGAAESILHFRVKAMAGPIETEWGTVRESVSRGSISGVGSQRIRDVLEKHAADGTIPWEAVDNIAPLQAHVTPAKIQQYVEDAPVEVAADLHDLLPEKRRSIKVEAAKI
jgi:hypothetical protein